MHYIRTHERYCQSRKTEPKQRFQARGERITLTLTERIEKGLQVTTIEVLKKKKKNYTSLRSAGRSFLQARYSFQYIGKSAHTAGVQQSLQ